MRAPVQRQRKESFLRWRDDTFEYRCSACGEWWPVSLEFWRPTSGVRRCKACQNERRREAYDPVRRAAEARRQWREMCRRRQRDERLNRAYLERQNAASRRYLERKKAA